MLQTEGAFDQLGAGHLGHDDIGDDDDGDDDDDDASGAFVPFRSSAATRFAIITVAVFTCR